MSHRGRNEHCRICGGVLQGNQRKWLFGGKNKRTRDSQPHTPTESIHGGSRSSQSSPWGSTLSLGSAASFSRSQLSICSTSKRGLDLLSVLTHILGRAVPRGNVYGEFVCSKCVSVLERVFKFDTVIARVRILSSERLKKMMQERDKIRRWVRQAYCQRHPEDSHSKGSTSEEEGEGDKEGYREMLRDNMALSEYECWSEKWDMCPFFIRTGKRCRKGKGCEGCDSLRVSDSDYESVCGIPRHLPPEVLSPLSLSRDKSQSMPLQWLREPSISSSPASLAGSSLSLLASSRTESVQSLDSLDGNDPFDSPDDMPVNFVLGELRKIDAKSISSPPGSRIPVLGKKEGRKEGRQTGGTSEPTSPTVNRILDFGIGENGDDGGSEVNGEDDDILSELRDEFVPLHRETTAGRLHHLIRHLRSQLDQAVARVRTLEAELKHSKSNVDNINGSEDWNPLAQPDAGGSGFGDSLLLQSFVHSLHSHERLVQEVISLMRRLCLEQHGGSEMADKLTEKMSETLKEILSDNKTAVESLRFQMADKERRLEEEMEALRKAGRDRERDLNTLNAVLQCNQDIISDLQLSSGEREQLQREVEKEREVWRQRDHALGVVLQEKEALLLCLRDELDSCRKDIQALSGSVIGQSLSDGQAVAAIASQLKKKEGLLAAALQDKERNCSTLWQDIAKVSAAFEEYQATVQEQQEHRSQLISSLQEELRDTRRELRYKEKGRKESERARQNDKENREREERKLRDGLEQRDKLIEQMLLDVEERDHLFSELQQILQDKQEPRAAVKHTL